MNKAYTELKKKNVAELEKEINEQKLELVKLDARLATGSASKEAGKIKNTKKKIARINTLINERRT
jgi:ribosomal protein L29